MTSTNSNDPSLNSENGEEIIQDMDIVNERGLHARASAKFVKCASGFDAKITVSREDQTVTATSIMGLMMLAACMGTQIRVMATGPEARESIEALSFLVADKFGEEC